MRVQAQAVVRAKRTQIVTSGQTVARSLACVAAKRHGFARDLVQDLVAFRADFRVGDGCFSGVFDGGFWAPYRSVVAPILGRVLRL